MLNLETAVTTRGRPQPKLYNFRTSPLALELLDAAGVDVVTMANNHGADFGRVGLLDSLAAREDGPLPVVGIGRDAADAFSPYRASVRGTDVAFLAAMTNRDYTARNWSAGVDEPGVATATRPRPRRLLAAVRAVSRVDDVVVVYLHWGAELASCPTPRQVSYARQLSEAGADIVVGSHAHVLLGSGWSGETYVNYGLGNFVWYNTYQADTGVLTLTVRDGKVVRDEFHPAVIGPDGTPAPLEGPARTGPTAEWEALRGCADLAFAPGDAS
jgi:poly-gamma-glutamate synthesis protein (capsule biosynthesis protein)